MTQVPQTTTDYQSFLKLMTAQMKHQDPLAPLDATQFVTQLAQFSQVEQSVKMNDGLDKLSSLMATLSAQSGTSMIGRSVETENYMMKLEEGEASFRLRLDETPAEAKYIIRNSAGDAVREESFDYQGEGQTITWDGKDDHGTALDDGLYTVEVAAKNAEGESIPGQTFISHKIMEVVQNQGRTSLVLESGQELDMSADMRVF